MNDCLQILRQLVKACEDILEDMEQQGLHLDGYVGDMDEARIYIAKARKLFKYREDADTILLGLAVRGLVPESDCLDKLTSDDQARLMVAFNACWDVWPYSSPVNALLAEFKEKYSD